MSSRATSGDIKQLVGRLLDNKTRLLAWPMPIGQTKVKTPYRVLQSQTGFQQSCAYRSISRRSSTNFVDALLVAYSPCRDIIHPRHIAGPTSLDTYGGSSRLSALIIRACAELGDALPVGGTNRC